MENSLYSFGEDSYFDRGFLYIQPKSSLFNNSSNEEIVS